MQFTNPAFLITAAPIIANVSSARVNFGNRRRQPKISPFCGSHSMSQTMPNILGIQLTNYFSNHMDYESTCQSPTTSHHTIYTYQIISLSSMQSLPLIKLKKL